MIAVRERMIRLMTWGNTSWTSDWFPVEGRSVRVVAEFEETRWNEGDDDKRGEAGLDIEPTDRPGSCAQTSSQVFGLG
jgi:hypothetical protein